MQQLLASHWFKRTIFFTAAAALLTFIPFSPLAMIGGVALVILLPGVQLLRWLGLYEQCWDFKAVVLSVALGLVTAPVLIYWSSLVFGFRRETVLIIFPLFILTLATWLVRDRASLRAGDPVPSDSPGRLQGNQPITWLVAALLIGVTALGVFLAYLEIETPAGFYPVQMEDWQKHYGVAFALRYTGIPPTSMFFYGMFPHEQLVYYYFLHLNGAALDLLQSGGPALHNAFVTVIVLASLVFSSVFLLLAQTLFRRQKAAVWALAFVTIIGGLDIVPTLQRTVQKYREHFPDGPLPAGVFLPREHIDNWISALSLRLNTFYAYHVWVPQHLTGLTILCLGCYLYVTVRERRKLLIILPVLLFSLLGHSTWLTLVILASLFLFGLYQVSQAYRRQGPAVAGTLFLGYAVMGLAFGVIAAPFILSLVGPEAPRSGLAFEIPKLDGWPILHPFQTLFGPAVWARLLDLPLHFFIEMGALLVAGLAGLILFWRAELRPGGGWKPAGPVMGHNGTRPPDPEPASPLLAQTLFPFWLFLLALGTLTVSLFASGRGWAELGLIQNNDLGLRALMPGQLVLALFAGYYLDRLPGLAWRRGWRWAATGALALLIGLGVTYAAWEFVAMGLSKYWDRPQLAPGVYQALRALPEVTYPPPGKLLPVVQHRLYRDAARFQLSLGGRPVGFSTGEAVVFHQDVRDLALALELSQQAFDNGLPVWSYQMFHNLGVDYIFVGPAEREAMRHPEKYRHTQYFQPVYQQDDFEIYRVEPWPYPAAFPQARFDGGAIELEGYFIDPQPVYPGDSSRVSLGAGQGRPGLVTGWRLTRPVDQAYTVFIHLVDAAGNVVAQADHQLWAWDVTGEGPSPTWTPRLAHLDIYPLPKEALTAKGPLTIRLGLWLPETGQRMPVETDSLKVDADGRLIVGELPR